MTAVMRLLFLAALLILGTPVFAQDTDPEGLETREIEAERDPAADAGIAERIRGIFSEIPALSGVTVEVREGVVTLSGEVANDAAAERAVRLASRLTGVVTVEESIERVVTVENNVGQIFDDLEAGTDRILRAWPVYLVALGTFLFIAVGGWLLAGWSGLWNRLTPNPFIAELISQIVRVAALFLAVIMALSILGATALLGTFAGGAGLLGLAIGFAVRDTIENYIASIMLSLRQPFRANERVKINDHEGVVIRLTSRATVLMTLDGNHLRIPNSDVFKGVILNYTRNPERRFEFKLGVDAEDDPVEAMKVGLDAIRALDFVLADPEPVAIIEEVGDSNIVLCFMAWVNQRDTDFAKARSLAIRAAKTVIEEHGFTLPEPIYRLRFDQAPIAVGQDASLEVTSSGSSSMKTGSGPVRPLKTDSEPAGLDAANLDVSPDNHIEKKVAEERAETGEQDLLDPERPVE
ncbi:mechanosensitive ion channel domain-containing protein [Hyphobacterium marinum]|uniref:Small-conductance mechanosensitive channel n=1 Tax=Hyphobacterium marinum TaxID=3116574 RepID=A0ABU7LX94_9PROT|nr:mechanosensitive ion channel domain-containing protein [Hyphobacterium sp. Y6023]MEE2565810.1 mechanosensitive ion channel domain-containing protein [Hyphobacterium sp. Y6023]